MTLGFSSYDLWKTTDPREGEFDARDLPEGEAVCSHCDGEGGWRDEDGGHVCHVCRGEGIVEVEPEMDEDEALDLASLEATCRDTDLTEADFEPPADEMTEADIEAMFRWYEARGITCYADLYCNDLKGRC